MNLKLFFSLYPSAFILVYFTGSKPPRANGWQRHKRQAAIKEPRIAPCLLIASAAYSEQVGVKRHAAGKSGEITAL